MIGLLMGISSSPSSLVALGPSGQSSSSKDCPSEFEFALTPFPQPDPA